MDARQACHGAFLDHRYGAHELNDVQVIRKIAEDQAKCATSHEQLIGELLDSRIPKTEREHAAAREIEQLRYDAAKWQSLAKCYEQVCDILQGKKRSGG